MATPRPTSAAARPTRRTKTANSDAHYGDADGNDCQCRLCLHVYRYVDSPEYCPECGERDTDPEDEEPTPITVAQLADYRLGRQATNGEDFNQAGLPIMGGCYHCHASIAAYNACPAKNGFLFCRECIGDGWYDCAEAAREIFGHEEYTVVSRDGKFTMPAHYQDEAVAIANVASRAAHTYHPIQDAIGFDVFRPGTNGPIYTAWTH